MPRALCICILYFHTPTAFKQKDTSSKCFVQGELTCTWKKSGFFRVTSYINPLPETQVAKHPSTLILTIEITFEIKVMKTSNFIVLCSFQHIFKGIYNI